VLLLGVIGTSRGSRTTTGSVLEPFPVGIRDGGRPGITCAKEHVQLPDRLREDLSTPPSSCGAKTCEVLEDW
jgi:hypothetical protein